MLENDHLFACFSHYLCVVFFFYIKLNKKVDLSLVNLQKEIEKQTNWWWWHLIK